MVNEISFKFINSYNNLLQRLNREGFNDSHRQYLVDEYLKYATSNFKYFIFGVDIKTSGFSEYLDYNLHNSFLTVHAYFGLIGLLGFSLLGIISIVRFAIHKKHMYLLILIVLLVRVSTDIIALPGYLDSIIFYFLIEGSTFKVGGKNENFNYRSKRNAWQRHLQPF